jgi:hypothetical protein
MQTEFDLYHVNLFILIYYMGLECVSCIVVKAGLW